MTAKGSWNSPIYISDDEDENDVAGQLICPESAPAPPATSTNQLLTSPPIYTQTTGDTMRHISTRRTQPRTDTMALPMNKGMSPRIGLYSSTSTPRTISPSSSASPPPPLPRQVTPTPPPPPPPPPAAATAAKVTAPKKPVSLIIGMNPDKDRHSKHGTFHPSPHAITSLPSNPDGSAYIPNPARTLVMEQLPKTHRTREFIKSWSKGACGAHPVYFAVDPPSAKALVEFATAELARKAWGSPKLGGVSGPPVKGKPRADWVWWAGRGSASSSLNVLRIAALVPCDARTALSRDLARRLRMEMALGQALQPRMKTSRTHRAYRLRHDLRPVRCVLERHCRCSSPPRTPTPPPFSLRAPGARKSDGEDTYALGHALKPRPIALEMRRHRLDSIGAREHAQPRRDTHTEDARARAQESRERSCHMSGACAVARIPQVAAPRPPRARTAPRPTRHAHPPIPAHAAPQARAPARPAPLRSEPVGRPHFGCSHQLRESISEWIEAASLQRRIRIASPSARCAPCTFTVHARARRAQSPHPPAPCDVSLPCDVPLPRDIVCATSSRPCVTSLPAARRAVLPASADSVLRTTYHP
ncbi:hypothetical protein DFH06DRAFT_1469097 [Mycena polygramma]|nr:hypothetical protein DFH06DRAFT_1469097 [Mycena polygramma]